MPMIKADEVTPRKFRNINPVQYKNRGYVTLEKGMTITVESVVFSVHQASKKADNGEKIKLATQDGKPVTNVTAYIGLPDNKFTSVNGDIAVCQLASIVGFDETEIGYYPFNLETPETITCIEIKEKYGDKEYPKLAFE